MTDSERTREQIQWLQTQVRWLRSVLVRIGRDEDQRPRRIAQEVVEELDARTAEANRDLGPWPS